MVLQQQMLVSIPAFMGVQNVAQENASLFNKKNFANTSQKRKIFVHETRMKKWKLQKLIRHTANTTYFWLTVQYFTSKKALNGFLLQFAPKSIFLDESQKF